MLSKKRSPIPVRTAKWIMILAVARRLYRAKWFWAQVFGLLMLQILGDEQTGARWEELPGVLATMISDGPKEEERDARG